MSSTTDIELINKNVLNISRITAICLVIAYGTYIYYQTNSHASIYNTLLKKDEEQNEDREAALAKEMFTLTECVVTLAVAITLVTIIAISCKCTSFRLAIR